MGDLVKLRQKRAELVAKMEGMLNEAGDADLTEEQAKDFEDTKKQIEGLDVQIKRAEDVQRLKAAQTTPAEPPPARVEVREVKPEQKIATVGKIVRCLAASKGIVALAVQTSATMFGEEHAATKALAAGVGESGAFLLQEEYSTSVIELLRARAAVRRARPVVVPMRGTLLMPRVVSGTTAAYVGENNNITKTQPRFGQLRLTSRKLAALVPISNDLLRNSSPSVDEVVVNDLVAGMANTEDAAFIREDGTGNAPKGMYHWANSGNITATAGTTAANIETDIKKLLGFLLNNNVNMIRPTWFMAPRSRLHLEFLRNTTDNLVFPEVGGKMQLKGYPIEETNNIPTNLGSGSNETELYLADMADAILAEETGIELTVSDTAAYHDGSQVVAAFSQDQTVIRAITKHDFGMRHDRSVAVITGITWGA